MAIKPILFNTPMSQAVRIGIKTETRRLINPRYRDDEYSFQIITNAHTGEFIRVEIIDEWGSSSRTHPPQYSIGDVLWVRESWAVAADLPGISDGGFVYRSDYTDYELSQLKEKHFCWKPSIHMPKAAARTFIKVTGVWAERLQNITATGIRAEGLGTGAAFCGDPLAREEFKILWDSTVPKANLPQCGFAANPWVWAYRFERCETPFERSVVNA